MRATLVVLGAALGARMLFVLWASSRIAPTADGHYYHVIAERIAAGHGYTWLWPGSAPRR